MAAHQIPLSMEFSRQKYWSELPFLPPIINKKVQLLLNVLVETVASLIAFNNQIFIYQYKISVSNKYTPPYMDNINGIINEEYNKIKYMMKASSSSSR